MRVAPQEFFEHLLLEVAKRRLAMLLEMASDRAPQLALDLRVGIDERPVEAPRELSSDGGFPTPRHADQDDRGHGCERAPKWRQGSSLCDRSPDEAWVGQRAAVRSVTMRGVRNTSS